MIATRMKRTAPPGYNGREQVNRVTVVVRVDDQDLAA